MFAFTIGATTALLMLPISPLSGTPTPFVNVLFTAMSTVYVTGLAAVSTVAYWSLFEQAVIVTDAVIGGLGVMAFASILGFAVSRHLGLTQHILAVQETSIGAMSRVSLLLKTAITTSLAVRALLAIMFLPRFLSMGIDPMRAVWDSVFMTIPVFNNAGFVIPPEGLSPHVTGWWVLISIILDTTVGAIGFPVIMDVAKSLCIPRRWRLHTKLTLPTYLISTFVRTLALALTEWNNPVTLDAIDTPSKILNTMLAGTGSRSSGLPILDAGAMQSQTHFVQDILMMIDDGSASTAGGVGVIAFAVLVLVVIAEARGGHGTETFGRRIPTSAVRLAVTMSLLGLALVVVSVVLPLSMTNYSLGIILFETASTFAIVGLSTGIIPALPTGARYMFVFLVFTGRTGSMTVVTALALRERSHVTRMLEERPITG